MANFSNFFQKMTNFLGISTGSSSVFAGSGPKSADFSKFSRLHLSKLAKSLENLTFFFDEIWFLFEIFKVSRGFVAKQETEIA